MTIRIVPLGLSLLLCTIIVCLVWQHDRKEDRCVTPQMRQDIALYKSIDPKVLEIIKNEPPLFGKKFCADLKFADYNQVSDAFLAAGAEPTSKDDADYLIVQKGKLSTWGDDVTVTVYGRDKNRDENIIKMIDMTGGEDRRDREIRNLIDSLTSLNQNKLIHGSK